VEAATKVVFQELSLIPHVSVAENVFLESFPLNKNKTIDWQSMYKDTENLLSSIGLEINPKTMLSKLTISQQQMVEIAKAIQSSPSVLILDEPTDGFSEEQVDRLRIVLDELNIKQIIIVSHESKIESFVENVIRLNKKDGVSEII